MGDQPIHEITRIDYGMWWQNRRDRWLMPCRRRAIETEPGRVRDHSLSNTAPMPSPRYAAMPSIRYYTTPERHMCGVRLVVPPPLEQILDLKVRAAQVEQVQ